MFFWVEAFNSEQGHFFELHQDDFEKVLSEANHSESDFWGIARLFLSGFWVS